MRQVLLVAHLGTCAAQATPSQLLCIWLVMAPVAYCSGKAPLVPGSHFTSKLTSSPFLLAADGQ